ncbi:MAG: class I SAM-dependent RNA methyltransferase [Chloroflexi bacterium]|nr:class I SAM-dependent RNA methyltransferase [Chloroflexota bacterium]
MELIATAAAGLEGVVARELRQLGYTDTRGFDGGVRVGGAAPADIPRLNLWLRSADRVKLVVGDFEATTFDALFEGSLALPWSELIPPGGSFPVIGRAVKSQLASVPDCQAIVKKAVVESLRRGRGSRADSDWLSETGPLYRIEVSLREDRATLSLDCSGDGLHKRGYRERAGAAPLRETLAAALVQLSFWRADRQLADLFCGSGTIAIEAALIGRDIAPGLSRRFASMAWPWIGRRVWDEAGAEAMDRAAWERPLDIQGSDIDPAMIELATANAQAFGLTDGLHFKQMRAGDFRPQREHGVAIANPPYGERSGEAAQVMALYAEMGRLFERWPSWSHYWLSGNPAFEAAFGRKAERRRKLFNAGIRCQYYQYPGPPPPRSPQPPT